MMKKEEKEEEEDKGKGRKKEINTPCFLRFDILLDGDKNKQKK
jgi:hypothetical protein